MVGEGFGLGLSEFYKASPGMIFFVVSYRDFTSTLYEFYQTLGYHEKRNMLKTTTNKRKNPGV